MFDEISSQKKNEYLETFKIFDKNNDGQITQDELKQLLNNIGQKPSDSEIQDMINEIDIDGDGKINFDNFITLMEKKLRDHDNEEELIETFKVFDKDGIGFITFNNLKDVIKNLGLNYSDDEIMEMIKECDLDKDMMINYDEFTKMVLDKY
jgi:calmodulin